MEGRNKAEELAGNIIDFVNSYSYDMDTFAEAICRSHKTLQQSTMRLFIGTIRKMADVCPDDRNAATVGLAREITKIADEYPLPFI